MKGILSGVGLVVLFVAALAGGWLLGKRGEAHRSAEIAALNRSLDGMQMALDSARQAAGHSQASAETLYVKHWLQAKSKIDTLTDTLPVPYPVVREIVRAADTTIQACRLAVTDCQRRGDLEQARADSLQRLAGLWKQQAAGPRITLWGRGETDLAGHWFAGVEARVRLPLGLTAYGRAETRLDSVAVGLRVGGMVQF